MCSYQWYSTTTDLIHSHPKCIDVTGLLQGTSHKPFRSHPIAASHNTPFIRPCCTTCSICLDTWQTKVTQNSITAIINQHIELKKAGQRNEQVSNWTIVTALRSPCTIFCEWRYTRPSEIWYSYMFNISLSLPSVSKWAYNLKAVAVRVALNVVTSVAVLQVWHHNKRLIIQFICPDEF